MVYTQRKYRGSAGDDDGERSGQKRPDLRAGDYDDVSIRCVGKRVRVTLNGRVGYDKVVPELAEEGSIGFRIGGPAEEVRYRDLRLIEMPAR